MNIGYSTQRHRSKAESLMSNSAGQRPVYLRILFSLRPERAVATKNRLTPFQGYGEMRSFQHRALPCANAKRALLLVCNDWVKYSNHIKLNCKDEK
jgi:hypothetical protein